MVEISEVKTYLREIRSLKKEIEELRMRIEELEAMLLPRAMLLKQDLVQTFGDPKRFENIMIAISELRDDLEYAYKKRIKRITIAERAVELIDNPEYRIILKKYYFSSGKTTWYDVADHIGYDVRHVQRLHGKALGEIAKTIDTVMETDSYTTG